MAYKMGLIGDYVMESGSKNGWVYQKWASGIVRLHRTYSGSIKAYAQSSFLIPKLSYPFPVYQVHDVACARVATGSGIYVYGYDNVTDGWSGVIATMNTIATGTAANIVAKIQVTGMWKDFEGGG